MTRDFCFTVLLINFQEAQQKSLYFADGQRKVDFVLVYTEPSKSKEVYREVFEKNLIEEGLKLEHGKREVGVTFSCFRFI